MREYHAAEMSDVLFRDLPMAEFIRVEFPGQMRVRRTRASVNQS